MKKILGCGYAECKYNKNYSCHKRKKPGVSSSYFCPSYERDWKKEEFTDEEESAMSEEDEDFYLQEERDSWSAEQYNGKCSYEPFFS